MKIWQGSCIVHNTFPVRRLLDAKAEWPGAIVVAHPECPEAVLENADFIGSTSAIVEYCATCPAQEFIVMTESGVNFSLEREAPGKRFHYVKNENCNCSECPFMRLNTLEKLRDSLRNLEPRVELPDDIMARALVPIERMLAVR
jgi:quinolinate synthase